MIRRINLLATVGPVAVAIAGLLMMHGLNNAAVILTDTQMAPHDDHRPDSQGALGVCVFAASMAGTGLAAVAAGRRHRGSPVAVPLTKVSGRLLSWSAPAGRSRLIDLGVLRL